MSKRTYYYYYYGFTQATIGLPIPCTLSFFVIAGFNFAKFMKDVGMAMFPIFTIIIIS
jgi:hypothetical protein